MSHTVIQCLLYFGLYAYGLFMGWMLKAVHDSEVKKRR